MTMLLIYWQWRQKLLLKGRSFFLCFLLIVLCGVSQSRGNKSQKSSKTQVQRVEMDDSAADILAREAILLLKGKSFLTEVFNIQ